LPRDLKPGLAVAFTLQSRPSFVLEMLLQETQSLLLVLIEHDSLKLDELFIGQGEDYRFLDLTPPPTNRPLKEPVIYCQAIIEP